MKELTLQKGDNGLHFVSKPVHVIDKATNTKKFVGNFDFVRYLTIEELLDNEKPERILSTFHASNDIDLQAQYRAVEKPTKKAEQIKADMELLKQAKADFEAGIITQAALFKTMEQIASR